MENIMVCNCKQVSVNDIEKALATMEKFSDVEKQFEEYRYPSQANRPKDIAIDYLGSLIKFDGT